MSSDCPVPWPKGPLRQDISGTEVSQGSQAVVGTVFGDVTLHNTYAREFI